jgi:ferredoxin
MTQARQAALVAAANYLAPEPVPVVSYRSQGRVLVVGEAAQVAEAMRQLADMNPVHAVTLVSLTGWLGAFDARWQSGDARFDLVLDLGAQPWFTMHQPPQGYFAPRDAQVLALAIDEIKDAVGEFEKPKFFQYQQNICAHSRAKLQGCDRCIDACSTEAISANGNGVRVEPHLCMGCGACAAVCPSGAMRYNYPSMSYQSGKLKAMLLAYAVAGGVAPRILTHAEVHAVEAGAFLPFAVHHVATVGLDWLLGAVALGAQQVAVLIRGDEAPQYVDALREQMVLGEAILHGLGYEGAHFLMLDEAQIAGLDEGDAPLVPSEAAGFNWFDEKRTTLEFCLEHFKKHAPQPIEELPMPAGAPFGTVEVDGEKCTLCYSCVSVCPAGALLDGAGQPNLNFIERNCVQCGLCETACPEDAIALQTRLLLTPQAQQKRVVHKDAPFECVRCGKVFGTRSMVLGMVQRLSGHSMFSTPQAINRLKMCGDCRAVDAMAAQQ